ncbi:MAG: DUF192 domain-containing protein [Chloroflexota bacterium]|nr:DUF192 domain-containing protein [Chloroflexota bacterium]
MHARTLSLLLSGLVIISGGCSSGSAPSQNTPTSVQTTATAPPSVTMQVPPSSTSLPVPPSPTTLPTQAVSWVPPTALVGTPLPGAVATLTAAPTLKTEQVVINKKSGEQVTMTVEVANTEPSRELGLMFRAGMDQDKGMLFVFDADVTEGFWMQNTILPLSIAFVQADGNIIDVKDMQPLDTTTVGASGPYHYAIEANQGFFTAHGITPGDKLVLPHSSDVVRPGMPNCAAAK